MKNCLYRFLNGDGEVIYIGKAKDLKQRLNGHNHLPKECYEEIVAVQYISFNTEDDMDFAERYFVPKEQPKYNTIYKYRLLNINIKEFDNMRWINYDKNNHDVNIDETILDCYKKQHEISNEQKEDDNKLILLKIKEEMNDDTRSKRHNNINNKKIINANTGEIFENMHEAASENNLTVDEIYDIVEHGKFYKYKHNKYFNVNLRLMYHDDFKEKYNANPTLFNDRIKKNTRKIICLSDNTVYSNIYEVAHELNMTTQQVLKSCIKAKNYNNNRKIDFNFAWHDDYRDIAMLTANDKVNR